MQWEGLDYNELTDGDFYKEARAEFLGSEISFQYSVGYIGYGNVYSGAIKVEDYAYEIRFSLTESGTGNLIVARKSDSIIDDEVDRFENSIIWTYDEFNDENTLIITDRYRSLGVYEFRTHTLNINSNIFGDNGNLVFDLELYELA